MITHIELNARWAQDHHRDLLALAERDRMAQACGGDLPLARRAARLLGRALLGLGAWLLRYGKVDGATTVYHPPVRSIKLN